MQNLLKDILEEHYATHEEETRLLARRGQVEYLTTMRYIHRYLPQKPEMKLLEVGAATGRYSITLAKEGYDVTAIELLDVNIRQLRDKLDGTEPISVIQGNALDLSCMPDNTFDGTLLLGPLYHLYTEEEKLQALNEAIRVTKKNGYIFAAYCLNDAAIIQYLFVKNELPVMEENGTIKRLKQDWLYEAQLPEDKFVLVRVKDIDALNAKLPATRVTLLGADGASHYIRDTIEEMDDKMFAKWMEFHFATCEQQDLVGMSNHALDILQKN